MINPGSYEKFGDGLSNSSKNAVYKLLAAITQLNKNIAKDPDNIMRYKKVYDKQIAKIAHDFDKEWKSWADNDIGKAYIAGLKYSEEEMRRLGLNKNIVKDVSNGSFLIDNPPPAPIPEIPGQTLLLFKKYENHPRFFGVFRNAAYYGLEEQRFQIIRKANDIYRQSAILAAERTFQEADIFTRLKFSQEMLDELAKKGIQTITYKNGAKYSLDTYCEMAGRTLTGRASLQASLNRFLQSGYTLVVVSSHFRACDLCTPYEGKTLSIERHPVYESVDDAETQGLFHPNCYCKDTEVYTNNGWKLFKDVKTEDKIFSLNPNNHIPEWCNFTKRFEYDSGNEMIEFKSNSFDLLVTRNHNMYIGTNSHIENKIKTIKWKMEHAENCLNKNFKQLRCVNWKGENLQYNTFGYTKKEFAFLLGIYMAEGHIDKNRNGNYNRIIITQYKRNCIKKIDEILGSMGFYFSGNRFIKDNKELAKYLKQFGKQPERYIPDYILNERPEIIREFLNAFLIGDGSIKENKSKLKNIKSISKTYYTSSKRLSEHIGECILKVDKYPSFLLNKVKGKLQKHKNGEYVCNYDIWRISENNSKMSYHNISPSIKHRGIQSKIINDYDGLVYCLELEKNHIMLIRRNGKISWCGNCKHDISVWFEGMEKQKPRLASGEQYLVDKHGYKEAQKISYNAQIRQRQIERNIRNWKRRSIVSLDNNSKKFADKKVKYWQMRQREHLKENTFLNRKYSREQIGKAH